MNNLHKSPDGFKVAAFYKFADCSGLLAQKPELALFCCARKICGTIILAPEGLNGTVAGSAAAIDELILYLEEHFPFAGAEVKYSSAAAMPFLRMKVRIKDEIVTLRAPEANPSVQVGTYVAPEDWNALISRGDVTLVDTRNDYEVGLGTFAGALDPQTQSFTEFKAFVAERLDPQRDRKVAMFCTGGIRCEKASSYLLSQGFEEVFHLKGGILGYLEKVPETDSRWQGECFVFDERVAVTHGLAEGEATLCRACRHPLTPRERDDPAYSEGISCPYCAGETHKHEAAAERQRQMAIMASRGLKHLGDAAIASAGEALRAKQARLEKTRREKTRTNSKP
ncbi:MAG TPA: rhodanese-related sulfurtransferase [Devosiaceae bacterium]|jgi:UPF0176 protein